MQNIRLAQSSARLTLLIALGFAAAALSLVPRTSASSLRVPLLETAPQDRMVPLAPAESEAAAPAESATPAQSASSDTGAAADAQQRTAPAILPSRAAPTAAPSGNAPSQRQDAAPSAGSGGGIVTVWDERGGPVEPFPRFK